jgi:predicted metal-dependent phosphotriesterase family hydrolase
MRMLPTALGDVAAADFGIISTHEHLFINLMRERRGDGLLIDEALMASELAQFSAQGGGAIFDLTTAELTPGSTIDADPTFTAEELGQTRPVQSITAIQRVSKQTGVHVLLGTGRYREPYLHGTLIDRAGVQGLASEMVHDLTVGFAETEVKAALIGEIGADGWFISAREERVHRAAARAHHATNAPIYTHSARWRVGLDQLELLTREGVAAGRIAIGHTDTVADDDYPLELAKRGVYVGFDTLSSFPLHALPAIADRIIQVARAGFLDRLLLGHDVCTNSELTVNGGTGFTGILGVMRDLLEQRGLGADELHVVLSANPIAFLQGE